MVKWKLAKFTFECPKMATLCFFYIFEKLYLKYFCYFYSLYNCNILHRRIRNVYSYALHSGKYFSTWLSICTLNNFDDLYDKFLNAKRLCSNWELNYLNGLSNSYMMYCFLICLF